MLNAPGMTARPVILLIYEADLSEDEDPARNLAEERRRLLDALRPLQQKGLADVWLRTDVTATSLVQLLRNHRDRVAILHFGGHSASSARLFTNGEPGANAYQPFSLMLERLPNLQLVFISGFLSEPLADDLLNCGAPIVTGSFAACDDAAAIALAEHFYTELAAGAGLEAAYQHAAAAVKLISGTSAASYRSDAIALPAAVSAAWPWTLHARRGAEDARAWNIPAAAGSYLFGLPPLPDCTLPENPYHQALAWYSRQEAAIFFGRGRQIRRLYGLLAGRNSSPLVLLSGQSGVGKSSLLEAGLIPRLEGDFAVQYVRRDFTTGAAATLRTALGLPAVAPDADLCPAWRSREQSAGRPLILMLDQVEEIFTRPLSAGDNEPEALAAACAALFAIPAERPQGRLLLSFRKEYLPEIEEPLRRRNLDLTHVLLERLDRAAILEVVDGPQSTQQLRDQYNLRIDPGLGERIAHDFSQDQTSPIATILQILLTEMWEKARNQNPIAPHFDATLYAQLYGAGILLEDFFRQRMVEFGRRQPDAVASGLLLDLLAFHTTPQGAAQQHSMAELEDHYGAGKRLPQLIQAGKDLRLLADPAGDRPEPQHGEATWQPGARLAHDTLAPVVLAAYLTSARPGQRARRILEHSIGEWQATQSPEPPPLNLRDLETVETGLSGMRLPTSEEQRLLDISRREQARARLRNLLLRGAGIAALCIIAVLSIAAAWFGYSAQASAVEANQQRQAADRNAAEAKQQEAVAQTAEATAVASAQNAARQRELAEDARIQAESNLQLAQEQQRLAEANARRSKANELANYVDEMLVNSSYDPSLALLLAEAAVVSTWDAGGFVTANADAALQRAIDAVHGMGWLRTLPNHRHADVVNFVAFRPDGRIVLSGGADQTLRLWDVESGRQINLLAGHVGPVISAAFAPDGAWLVSGGDDGRILLWDLAGGSSSITLAQTGSWVRSVAVRHDGNLLAAGLDTGAVLLLTPEAGVAPQELPGHVGKVNSVAFAPGGDQLATAGADGTIRLWDTATGAQLAILPGHAGETRWVGYAGSYFYSAGDDGSIKQWDAVSGLELAGYQVGAGGLRSAAISADGTHMASVHDDSSVRVWPLAAPHNVERFFGHEDATLAVAFSPDGTQLVTGGADKSVRVWDLASKEELPAWGGHTGEIRTAIFSPDERTVLTTGHDGTVRLWDVEDGSQRNILRGGPVRVMNRAAAFSPDGSKIVIGADDGAVRIWQPGSGVQVCALANGQAVYSTSFSPDGALLLISGAEGALRLLDAVRCNELRQFAGHTGVVRSAYFDESGERILSAGDDGAVRIWSVETGQEVIAPLVHNDWVLQAVFRPDGRQVATGSRDRMVRIWDAQSGELLAELGPHTGEVRSVAYSPDGRLLAAADVDGITWLWDTASGHLLRKLFGHKDSVRFVAFSPQGNYLATAGYDGTARIWAVQPPPSPPHVLSGHHDILRSVAYSPDGQMLATAGVDGAAILWDAATGQQLRVFDGEAHTIWSLVFSRNSRTLLAGCDDGYVRAWPVDADQPPVKFKVSPDAVRTIALSQDGKQLATAGKDRIVRIWDAAAYNTIRLYPEGSSTVLAATFHPDGTILATAGEDGRISIWSTESATKLRTIADPSGWVWALSFSPNGNQLAAAGRDGRVRLFNAANGLLEQEFDSENGLAATVQFSPDGSWLFSAGEDGPIRVWDTTTGARIRQLAGHPTGVWALSISPDGQTLASAGADQAVRLWQTDIEATLAAAQQMVQRDPPLFLPVEQELYAVPPALR